MNKISKTIALAAVAAFAASATFAAAPTSLMSSSAQRTAVFSLFHPKKPFLHPKKPIFAGNIIGNKRTHVYHMPGDPGALPSPQNRVYFRTQAQAIAAGYHRAGSHGTHMAPHHPMHPMLHH